MSQTVLERVATPAGKLDELAVAAAPRARQAAAGCRVDPETGESCAWYHGGRLYARALGIGVDKSFADQAGFFTGALGALAADGARRVLVSGTADYAMPALVIASFRAESAALDLSVLDRCPTPLVLTRWYAARRGTPIQSVTADILDYAPAEPFDVVCSDSFIAQFPDTRRADLIGAWHRALRAGGRLVTTNRLRPTSDDDAIRNEPARIGEIRDMALRAAAERPGQFDVSPAEVARAVADYAARKRTYPVRSEDEISALFRAGGFRVDRIDVTGNDGSRNAGYARIVATRL